MFDIQYILGVVGAVLTLAIVIEMLRRRHLRERHAIWWLLAGIFALVISIFPATLDIAAKFLGFEIPVNLVFFTSLFVLFLVALQHSSELTTLESHNRRVAEELVLVQLKVEQLENQINVLGDQ